MATEILRMDGITKIYGNGFMACKGVTLCVNKGEIHGLIGENGAGKSTLMKVLFGLETPQEGKIIVEGAECVIKNPLDATDHKIGMVHQHFMQVPNLSIAENITLGIEPVNFGVFDKKKAIDMTREVSEKYHLNVDPTQKIRDVSVGIKQKVEILKALIRGVHILILDEPTAVLTPQETEELFVQLKHLKEAGLSVIFISHKLEEVLDLCDRVTVMRHGKVVCEAKETAGMDATELSRLIVGREVITEIKREKSKPTQTLLSVENVSCYDNTGRAIVDNVSFNVHAGEIVGIAGVEGNGQRELSNIIAGMQKAQKGKICLNQQDTSSLQINQIRDLGMAYISEDRMKSGCAPALSVRDNLISTRLKRKDFRNGILINEKKAQEYVDQCIKEFEIACRSPKTLVGRLSGGNIQKVVVAREFTSGANFVLASQPTRGVDIGVTTLIRELLVKYTRENEIGVLLISSDLNEIFEISDRLLVMKDGKIVAAFDDVSGVTDEILGEYMLGLREMDQDAMEGKL